MYLRRRSRDESKRRGDQSKRSRNDQSASVKKLYVQIYLTVVASLVLVPRTT